MWCGDVLCYDIMMCDVVRLLIDIVVGDGVLCMMLWWYMWCGGVRGSVLSVGADMWVVYVGVAM